MATHESSDSLQSSIYRYVSFESFIDTIQRRALVFVAHDLFMDPYEGYLFKAIKTYEGQRQIKDILKRLAPDDHMWAYASLLKFEQCIHAQSWSKCGDSDALWRLYSSNQKSLRIEVSIHDITQLKKVNAHEINYLGFDSLEDEVRACVDIDKRQVKLLPILIKKRPAFSYEREVRLVSDIDVDFLPGTKDPKQQANMRAALEALRSKGEINDKQLETGLNSISYMEKPKIKYIGFEHIEGFIKSVMVSPTSPNWFVETVHTFCKNNDLPFAGRSKLYTFEMI